MAEWVTVEEANPDVMMDTPGTPPVQEAQPSTPGVVPFVTPVVRRGTRRDFAIMDNLFNKMTGQLKDNDVLVRDLRAYVGILQLVQNKPAYTFQTEGGVAWQFPEPEAEVSVHLTVLAMYMDSDMDATDRLYDAVLEANPRLRRLHGMDEETTDPNLPGGVSTNATG